MKRTLIFITFSLLFSQAQAEVEKEFVLEHELNNSLNDCLNIEDNNTFWKDETSDCEGKYCAHKYAHQSTLFINGAFKANSSKHSNSLEIPSQLNEGIENYVYQGKHYNVSKGKPIDGKSLYEACFSEFSKKKLKKIEEEKRNEAIRNIPSRIKDSIIGFISLY